MPSPKLRRYLPPVRTSISQDRSVMPIERGTHQRLNSSGLLQASNTRRAGASINRVTTISRSDLRSTAVRCFAAAPLPFLASIDFLPAFQFVDDLVQRAKARFPELAVLLDPGRDSQQSPPAEFAVSNPANLLGHHQPSPLQHADVFLHAGECHVETIGEVRDRGVGAAELLEHAAAREVGQ